MIALEQRFKDLYNVYGGKHVRLVFCKKEYHTPRPANTLMPSYQLYPSRSESDIVDFVIGDDMIHSDTMVISESLCSDEDLNFGSCEAANMEIVVSGNRYIKALYPHNGLYPHSLLVPADNLIGREFALVESFFGVDKIFPHNGLYPSGGFYPSKDIVRGIFTVDSVPKEDDRDTRRIIAYDRMTRFDKDVSEWYESMTFPMPLKRFRASLCSYVGIKETPASLVNDDLVVEKTLDTEVLNGRDLMRYICQINGVFGNINHSGELRYVTIPKSDAITDAITKYKTVDSEEYMVPSIDKVKIRQEEADVGGASAGGGTNFYVIEGNILAYNKTTPQLNDIANKILPKVTGLEYRPATIVGNGAPWYEVGDRLLVRTSDGDVNTVIMKRTSSGIQGPMDTVESTGNQELNQVFNLESQMIQTKGLVAKVKFTVEEVSSELINFQKETSTKFTQTAEKIELEAKRAQKAEEELSAKITITADSITSEVNKTITATETKLNSKITQTSEQIATEVRRASTEERALSSRITQTASDITAEVTRATASEGTLSARISINSESISTKVSKGTLSSEISQEAGLISLTSNRLIVDSTNFKLDDRGNAKFSGEIVGGSIRIDGQIYGPNVIYPYWFDVDESGLGWDSINSSMTKDGTLTAQNGKFSGSITAANITGSTITGNTINGGTITGTTITGTTISGGKILGAEIKIEQIVNKPIFKADDTQVWIGDFYMDSKEYGRGIFQSSDEFTGMSTGDSDSPGNYLLWAGYGTVNYDFDCIFAVNKAQVHAVSEFYLHGSRGTINVYEELKKLWNAIGSGGGGGGTGCDCDEEEDCYSCSGHSSCHVCSGYHDACGPGTGTAN